jgi:hypothetical protein
VDTVGSRECSVVSSAFVLHVLPPNPAGLHNSRAGNAAIALLTSMRIDISALEPGDKEGHEQIHGDHHVSRCLGSPPAANAPTAKGHNQVRLVLALADEGCNANTRFDRVWSGR